VEIERIGSVPACSQLSFDRKNKTDYPWGPMPWKREEPSADFQWSTEYFTLPFRAPTPSPPYISFGPPLTKRQKSLVFQGTFYSDCSFDLYFSKGLFLEEGVEFGGPHFVFYEPRKDGVRCLPESDFSNSFGKVLSESPICGKFPSYNPGSTGIVISSPMTSGKDCGTPVMGAKKDPFQMKLIRD
jgi:hypothetical protein